MELLLIWINYGTPLLMLVILFLLSYLIWALKEIQSDIKDIKNGVIWKDTFEQFETRVKNLETVRNQNIT